MQVGNVTGCSPKSTQKRTNLLIFFPPSHGQQLSCTEIIYLSANRLIPNFGCSVLREVAGDSSESG